MTDRIHTPYTFSEEELQRIKDNFTFHGDWEKVVFDDIKKNIVDHLRQQQGNTCCYCKYQLGYDIKQVDIEHIVPKSKYEKFTFNGKNLALSCPACNTIKSTKEVLKKTVVRYPQNSNHFRIIHAHYDNYSEHIDIVNKCIFVARTSKGSETITFCNLFRLSVIEEKVKAYQDINLNSIYQIVSNLSDVDPDVKKKLIDIILDTIR
ncbi:HNH endonuclease [Psychrobacter pocilloporae]|uniref:HNH domain-containing protein n=1 Tax=Psychrobacter pocilloporae TaxID=1775882 RepID=A0ABT6IUT0_9GAMM|nr:HNH endonuclease [Psychrobacter pocilloporae]MDH4905530.1 hypothetical protein [Psychrobacter pocilloporae]